ncbi:MAG: hypothetical protein QG671_2289, partial [Actinomycetota bacterium]|nr:hypothetical protein [Actinomycetota bacterium]
MRGTHHRGSRLEISFGSSLVTSRRGGIWIVLTSVESCPGFTLSPDLRCSLKSVYHRTDRILSALRYDRILLPFSALPDGRSAAH